MSRYDDFLRQLAKAPDSQLDAKMAAKVQLLIGKSDEQVKTGLLEILDYSAAFSLASDFVMKVLNNVWKELGGKNSDPAPWRKTMYGEHGPM